MLLGIALKQEVETQGYSYMPVSCQSAVANFNRRLLESILTLSQLDFIVSTNKQSLLQATIHSGNLRP